MDSASGKAWEILQHDYKAAGTFTYEEGVDEPFKCELNSGRVLTASTVETLRHLVIANIARPTPRVTTP